MNPSQRVSHPRAGPAHAPATRRRRAVPLLALPFIAATLCGLVGSTARGQTTVTWTGTAADGNWDSGGNWSTGSQPVNGDTLAFSGTTQTTSTNTITSGSYGGLLFSNDGEPDRDGQFALSGNLFTLGGPITTTAATTGTLADSIANNVALAATTTITTGLNHDLTLSGIVSGAGFGITKNGNGLLTLSGVNTFTGPVTLNSGTLRATTSTSALGTGAATLALNGGTLLLANDGNLNFGRATTLSGSTKIITGRITGTNTATTHTLGTLTGSGTLGIQRVNVTGAQSAQVTFGATTLTGDLVVAFDNDRVLLNLGAVSESGGARSLTLEQGNASTAVLNLTGSGNWSGGTTVKAGVLRATAAQSLGAPGTTTTVSGGVVDLRIADAAAGRVLTYDGNATLQLAINASTTWNIGSVSQTAGTLTVNAQRASGTSGNVTHTFSNPLDLNGNVTFNTVNAVNLVTPQVTTLRVTGSITDAGGNGTLRKTGAGVLSLEAPARNRGLTQISNGTLRLGGADFLNSGTAAGNFTMNPTTGLTATLALNGFNQTLNGFSSSGAGTSRVANDSGTNVTLTIGGNDGGGTFAGQIVNTTSGSTGTLALVKTGAGTIVLTGANTYTGVTDVRGGVLSVSPVAVATSSAIRVGVDGDAAFNLYADNALAALTMASNANLLVGGTTSVGTLGFTLGSAASAYDAIVLQGTGGVTVGAGGGRIAISGTTGFGTGSYTLVSGPNAIVNGTGLVFDTSTAPVGYTYSLSTTSGTALVLTVGNAEAALWWAGGLDGSWKTVTGGSSNWSTTSDGLTNAGSTPGTTTTVRFSGTNVGAGDVSTTLDYAASITGLDVLNTGATTLVIAPGTGGSLTLGTGGIAVQANAPALTTISTPVTLNGNQTWNVADAGSLLDVSGILSGGTANSSQGSPGTNISLTITGSGAVALGNSGNTFTGDVLVDGATLQVSNLGGWGGATVANATSKTIALQNGGTLEVLAGTLNPANAASTSYKLVQIGAGGGRISVADGAILQFDDLGQLYGVGDLTKTGSGTLWLGGGSGQTTYTGTAMYVNEGVLRLASALASGSVAKTIYLGDTTGSADATLQLGTANNFAIAADTVFVVRGGGTGVKTIAGTNTANINTLNGTIDLQDNLVLSAASSGTLTLSGAIGETGGARSVTKQGAGTVILSGSNAYTGGTRLEAGVLSLGNADALGPSGLLTFAGGTLRFSSSNTVDYSSRFSTAADQRYAFDTNSETVTLASPLTSVGGSLTKLGAGTLVLAAANSYSGTTTVSAGTLQLGDGTTNGSITGSVVNNATLAFDPAGSFTFGNGVTGSGILSKVGTGTLTFTGTSTATGAVNVTGGQVLFDGGSLNNGASATAVGSAASARAVLRIVDGTYDTTTLGVGNDATGTGVVVIDGGRVGVNTTNGNLGTAIGTAAGGYGGFFMASGTFSTMRFDLGVNGAGGTAVAQITGGQFIWKNYVLNRATRSELTFGGTVDAGRDLAVTGQVFAVDAPTTGGIGIVTLGGGALNNAGQSVAFGRVASTGTATLNLTSGTLTTNNFTVTAQVGLVNYLNLSGGTIRANVTSATFLPAGLTGVYVNGPFGSNAGGAVFDTNAENVNVTVAANLLAPTGSGVTTIPVTAGGSGFIGAPFVEISGDGFGASASATVDLDPDSPTYGQVLSITVTNPGNGYTSEPTITLVGGGGTGVTLGTPTLAANTSGGLTKLGNGTLTLTGTNTYTGATDVRGGTLSVSPLALATSSAIRVGVDGDAALNLFADNALAALTMANNANLLVGGTTSVGTLGFTLGSNASAYDAIVLQGTGGVTVGAAGGRIAISGTTGFGLGSYTLVSGPTTFVNPEGFVFDTATAPGGYTYSLSTTSGTAVVLTVGNAVAELWWAGGLDGSWKTVTGGSSNWSTTADGLTNAGSTPGTTTTVRFSGTNVGAADVSTTLDYAASITGLDVLNTGATTLAIAPGTSGTLSLGTGGITLQTGAPTTTISAPTVLGANQTWSVASGATLDVSGIVSGSGNMTKSGAGMVVLSAANTFTGTTTLNGGVLRVTTAGNGGLGAGTAALVATSGTLEIASDAARALARPTTVNGDVTISTQRLTAGAGVTHTLGTLSIGGQTLTVTGTGADSGTQGLTFGAVTLTGAPTFTVNNNTNGAVTLLTLGTVTNSTHTATINGSGNVAQAGVWGNGSGGITYNGTGLLTLNQANTFTGAVTLNSGTIAALGNNGALGTGAATLTLAGGTLLAGDGTARSFSRNTTVTGNVEIITRRATAGAGVTHTLGTLAIGGQTLTVTGTVADSGTQGLTFGAVTLSGDPTFTVNNNTAGAATMLTLGAISGANRGFTKNGNGTLVLNTNSTFNGTLTLQAGTLRNTTGGGNGLGQGSLTLAGGRLELANSTARNSARPTTVTGNVTVSTEKATLGSGVTHTLGTLSIGGQTLTVSGTLANSGTQGLAFGATTLTGNPTFHVVNNNGDAAATALTLGALAGADRGLTKSGNGTLVLSAAATATNLAVTLTGGRLESNNASALGTGATLAVASGATFAAGAAQSVSGLSGAGTVQLSGGSLTVSQASGTSIFTGQVTGAQGLVKTGAGTLALAGISDFAGTTTVSAGTLLVNGTTTGGGAVTVSAGATLGGLGRIQSSVAVSGTLSPGASIGRLSVDSTSFENNSAFLYEFDSSASGAASADVLLVNGGLTLTGTVNLLLSDLASVPAPFVQGTTYTLVNYTGAWNAGLFTFQGTPLSNGSQFSWSGADWQIKYDATAAGTNATDLTTGSFVNVIVVPEPGTLVFTALGLAGLAWRLRRRPRT